MRKYGIMFKLNSAEAQSLIPLAANTEEIQKKIKNKKDIVLFRYKFFTKTPNTH